MVQLSIEVLGGFTLRDEAGAAIRVRGSKAQALIAYLALNPGRPAPRDQLADLLWGSRMDAQARQSLRQAISTLRKSLGAAGDLLIAEGETLALDESRFETDAAAFERAVTNDGGADAAALYAGDLLHGVNIKERGFEDWLRGERERLRDLACSALLAQAEAASGDAEAALAAAKRLVFLAPLREAGHRALMRLYVEAGRPAAALKQFKILSELLSSELDAAPSPETVTLLEHIKGRAPVPPQEPYSNNGGVDGPISPSLPVPRDKVSIAVLPFDNRSGDPEQDYFADGITEDLITALTFNLSLFVIARNSSFTYKGRAVDVTQVARELGVRYVVEGSVRKAGNRVRVTAQLIDATTAGHAWAEQYDRDLEDIFALQDEIVGNIAAATETHVNVTEGARAHREHGGVTALDHIYRATHHLYKFTAADNWEAQRILEDALRQFPDHRIATVFLALSYWTRAALRDSANPVADLAISVELSRKVLASNESYDFGHWNLAVALYMQGQHNRALIAASRAYELNPHSTVNQGVLGMVMASAGRPKDGVPLIVSAIRADPRSPLAFLRFSELATAHFMAADFGEATDWARKTVQRRNDWIWGYFILAASLGHLGKLDEAKEALSDLLAIHPKANIKRFLESPIVSRPEYQVLLAEGLRKAGLAEG